jgi:hypothetical protein
VSEEQGAILIKHVSAGAKIARGSATDVWIPHAGDSWPVELFAATVWRLAISRQEAKASGVALRDIQDRFG